MIVITRCLVVMGVLGTMKHLLRPSDASVKHIEKQGLRHMSEKHNGAFEVDETRNGPTIMHAMEATVEYLNSTNTNKETSRSNEAEQEMEYGNAVLFPAFCVVLGALVYFLLTRIGLLSHLLPYTAVMFLIGTFMGLGTTLTSSTNKSHLAQSINMWTNIQSEVLLLVFLPGLVFKDALGLNVHLFSVAFWQNFIFAFPLVLGGTILTALVAFYVFPWNWSFNLCMTFGSILSATDPVAVAALMEKLGAPPRLKVHISGEALLNDGSAIVFYSIFVLRYLYELGVEGKGEDIGWAQGIAKFFRMSLGGAAIGLFFALVVLVIFKILDRRFTRAENVTQVSAMLGLAYVNYFCADMVWETSGVIATVVGGLTVAYFGRATTNDAKLLDDFWSLLDNLLNTVLFTLGGVVWGDVLASSGPAFGATEWGFLICLFVMLTIIRYFLFIVSYPLINHIGLQTSWPETIFQVHGGLRGAVGIALALSLDNHVARLAAGGGINPIYPEQTRRVFGLVGGIAFMTLILNAPTCKPLLSRLGLSESSEMRKKILGDYRRKSRNQMLQDMVDLLSQPRFRFVRFPVIKRHIPALADLTTSQLADAIAIHQKNTPDDDYVAPNVDRIVPYLRHDGEENSGWDKDHTDRTRDDSSSGPQDEAGVHQIGEEADAPGQAALAEKDATSKETQEFRELFLSMLRSAYKQQISKGELAERDFLTISLEQSLDLAHDQVLKGQPLNDWRFVNLVDPTLVRFHRRITGKRVLGCIDYFRPGTRAVLDRTVRRFEIERALAFIAAHRSAESSFKKEFGDAGHVSFAAGRQVLDEGATQLGHAEQVLDQADQGEVTNVVSHKFCSILITLSIIDIGKLVEKGLLKEEEAEHWVGEMKKELDGIDRCARTRGIDELAEAHPL